MKSRLGILRDKFDNSGIDGHKKISDEELEELRCLLMEFSLQAEDFKDMPLSWVANQERQTVERCIAFRKER